MESENEFEERIRGYDRIREIEEDERIREIEDERFIFELQKSPDSHVITMIIGPTREFKEIQIDSEDLDFLISCFRKIDEQLGKQVRMGKPYDPNFKDAI